MIRSRGGEWRRNDLLPAIRPANQSQVKRHYQLLVSGAERKYSSIFEHGIQENRVSINVIGLIGDKKRGSHMIYCHTLIGDIPAERNIATVVKAAFMSRAFNQCLQCLTSAGRAVAERKRSSTISPTDTVLSTMAQVSNRTMSKGRMNEYSGTNFCVICNELFPIDKSTEANRSEKWSYVFRCGMYFPRDS
jgi:hypothetical protein